MYLADIRAECGVCRHVQVQRYYHSQPVHPVRVSTLVSLALGVGQKTEFDCPNCGSAVAAEHALSTAFTWAFPDDTGLIRGFVPDAHEPTTLRWQFVERRRLDPQELPGWAPSDAEDVFDALDDDIIEQFLGRPLNPKTAIRDVLLDWVADPEGGAIATIGPDLTLFAGAPPEVEAISMADCVPRDLPTHRDATELAGRIDGWLPNVDRPRHTLTAWPTAASVSPRAYMPSGVCSATRSALITGVMQTTLGAHNHRSGRGRPKKRPDLEPDLIRLPQGITPLPTLMRDAGYYTFNQGKTDYNFAYEAADLYDHQNGTMRLDKIDLSSLWRPALEAGKPFFGQIQLRGGKNRAPKTLDRAAMRVAPYYPDHELVREEYAHHYECVAKTDVEVGRILAALEADGLAQATTVVFFSDHGFRMHRHKQFLYEGGIRVPLVAAGPGVTSSWMVRNDLVSGIDLAATTLSLAGIEVPTWMQGRDLFVAGAEPRPFVVAARDRCDYTIDRIRAVVTPRFKYIRNGMTDRPYLQPNYRDPWPVTKAMRALAASGRMNEVQMAFYGPTRPAEELYDLARDPHEVRNLATDDAHATVLAAMRKTLDQWIEETGDLGQEPESRAGLAAVLAQWGERCVNPEYDAVRRDRRR